MPWVLDENDNLIEVASETPTNRMPISIEVERLGTGDPGAAPVDVSGVQPPLGARAPFSTSEQLAPSPIAMSPDEVAAAERMRQYDLGMVYQGGVAGREAGYVPAQRVGAIADINRPERENLGARERGLARDQRDMTFDENTLARTYARNREVEAQEEVLKKEHRVATIDSEVSAQNRELTQLMDSQRQLIDKGISPWEAYGSGSKAQGQMSAALTMAAAGFAGPEYSRQATQMIDTIINRDIENQKFAIELAGEQTENAYSRLLDKYGDRDQAESALRMLMGDAAKAELESMILESADPRAALAAEETILAIDKSLLAENEAFRARSIGTVTEKYNQRQVARAGGMRAMSPKEWDTHLKSRAVTAGTEAGTVETYTDIEREQLKASALASGEAAPSFTGKTKLVNDYVSASAALDALNELSKMRPGEEGLDLETGQYIGKSGEFWADRVPGRGRWDVITKGIPGANEEGLLYDRKVAQTVNAYRKLITGQAGAIKELERIESQIDSSTESAHLAGIQALTDQVLSAQRGIEVGLSAEQGAYLKKRRQEVLGTAAEPGSFQDVEL